VRGKYDWADYIWRNGWPTQFDIGLPTFGMHSIRDSSRKPDADGLYKVLTRLQSEIKLISR